MVDVCRVVLFLFLVNILPPIASIIFGDRYSSAVDGGKLWFDGHPIFGNHKTMRGVAASVVGGALAFFLLGVTWWIAGIAALLAMIGDLTSSFIKRRSTFASGEEVILLDQIFEGLFPLLFLNIFLVLDPPQNLIILLLFIFTAFWSSRLWLHITKSSVPKKYPRIIRSNIRIREWRTCHEPLARWQTWFNLTSFLSNQICLTWFFKLTGLYTRGTRNALDIKIVEKTFFFPELPASFDGFRVLFLVDLHLDGLEQLEQMAAEMVSKVDVDLCCIGGDIRMKTYGQSTRSIKNLKNLMLCVQAKFGVFGVLGNHDCIEMLPDCEDAGIIMLVNDSWPIAKDGARIWVMGVDDPHYYKLHDANEAAKDIPTEDFSIFLAHSPEAFADAAEVKASLYLCGHTHGGQICRAGGTPIITNSRAPRYTAVGEWLYRGMQGYTSRGLGPSSIPVRFNCPGEITVITLKKKNL